MNTKALMPSNSDPDTHPTAFLAPKTGNRTQKVTKYVIDPHCHIYNATDWQIAGALRGPLANEIENPFTRWMLKQLAVPVEKISRSFSLSAASELKRLSAWEKLEAAEAKKQMESYISDPLEWLAEQLERLLKGSVLEFGINAILGHGPTIFTRDNHEKFDRKFLLDAFRHCPDPDRPGKVETQLDKMGLASVPGLFIFLRHIMSPRFANLLQYQEGFTTGEGSLGIDMCFASLLDFDYWIGDDDHAESALPDQIDLMEKISALSNGYMQPIVPYNPWTDIEDNDDSIRLVEYAVRHKGFIGVKIYPQLGYYPNKNAEQEYPADGIHPYLPMLDEKLNHFFSSLFIIGQENFLLNNIIKI